MAVIRAVKIPWPEKYCMEMAPSLTGAATSMKDIRQSRPVVTGSSPFWRARLAPIPTEMNRVISPMLSWNGSNSCGW